MDVKHDLYDKRTNVTVPEDKMSREIYGPMKNEVRGKYSIIGNKELNDLYEIISAPKSRSL